jgi:hypothetical protein
MTDNRHERRLAKARAAKDGITYTAALRLVRAEYDQLKQDRAARRVPQ